MSKKLTVKVEFCGSSLEGVIVEGKAYVAMKPIVEGMGLDWSAQLAKMKDHPVLSKGMGEITIPTAGGKQKMMCLPESKLPFWMALIQPNKVKPSLRDKIIRYQSEAADVLHQAFTKGVADTNMRVMAIDSKRAAGRLMADITKDVLLLTGKDPKPYHFSNEHRLVNWVLTGEFSGIEEETLDAVQLDLLAGLRRRNAALIGMGMAYELRKKALEVFSAEWRHDRLARLAA